MFFKNNKKAMFKKSYSQSAEDMIIDFLFEVHGVKNPTYIDIGAHDPYYLSNTAFFYEKGCRGINIEPNPVLYKNIREVRKEDINLNVGIGKKEGKLNFYIMNNPTMSTFSREQADELVHKHGFLIEQELNVDVSTVNTVLNTYNNGVFPDFLSLDVEGVDLVILQSIDFSKSYPKVICVETMEYTENLSGNKESEIIDFLKEKGYRIIADTFINTIFERWN